MNRSKVLQISLITIILIISFTLVSFMNYRTATQSIRNELVSSSLPLLRENIYSEIEKGLLSPLSIAGTMAHDSFLMNWVNQGEENRDEIIRYLSALQEKYGFVSTFFVSHQSGMYYHHQGVLKVISPRDDHDVWYYNFIKSGKEYDLDVDSNQAASNELTIFINYLVKEEDKILGVTGVGIRMDIFSRFLLEREEKYKRRIYLTDKEGTIQAHPVQDVIETLNIRDSPSLSSVASRILSEYDAPINMTTRSGKDVILVTSRYIPEIGWFLIVEENETDAIMAARQNLKRTLLTGLVTSLVISLLCSLIISRYQRILINMAKVDPLTGLNNRHSMEEFFGKAQSRIERYGVSLSLILIDLDHFKEINDKRGHIRGDRLLKNLADFLKETVRPDDFIARWGGDEFAILLESEPAEALATGERILSLSQDLEDISLSMGVTAYRAGESLESVTARADRALYLSKERGRNRITPLD